MPIRKASAVWEGNLPKGKGTMKFGNGAFEGPYSFGSRFEGAAGTNPEELIAAAHAGCFSMALAHGMSMAGHIPKSVQTTAKVHLDKLEEGFKITTIELHTEVSVSDLSDAEFQKFAENAKNGCPVSQLVTGAEVKLEAKLVG